VIGDGSKFRPKTVDFLIRQLLVPLEQLNYTIRYTSTCANWRVNYSNWTTNYTVRYTYNYTIRCGNRLRCLICLILGLEV